MGQKTFPTTLTWWVLSDRAAMQEAAARILDPDHPKAISDAELYRGGATRENNADGELEWVLRVNKGLRQETEVVGRIGDVITLFANQLESVTADEFKQRNGMEPK